MKRRVLIASIMMTGCVPLRPSAVGSWQEIAIYPKVAPLTQAVLNPLSLSSIATLDVVPYVSASGSYYPISAATGDPTTVEAGNYLKLTQASPSIDQNRPFVLRRLKPNRNYRIYGRAYDGGNALISKETSSFVDVAVGNDDAPAIATLPVALVPVPFAATTSVTVNAAGRFDYLKHTLSTVSGNTQVAVLKTSLPTSLLQFGYLQGNTDYRLVTEAYKLGGVVASNSLTFNVGSEQAPTSLSLSLTVPYVTTTVAGNSASGSVNAQGTAATFYVPYDVTVDSIGNLYVADTGNQLIRKIAPGGLVSTLAGSTIGFADGQGAAAKFNGPSGLTVDNSGNVYVADCSNHRIRKIDPSGNVTTIVGSGAAGFYDAQGVQAQLSNPTGVCLDSAGNLYVADQGNHRIRKVDTSGNVTTVAGNGVLGAANGAALSATFNYPHDVAIDGSGNLFVADFHNFMIRKISGGNVTTLAGNGSSGCADGTGAAAQFNWVYGFSIDAQGNIYFGDEWNQRVRKVTPAGVVTTIAGGNAGTADGINASFARTLGVGVDALGCVYVADGNNNRIRKVQ